MLKLVWNTDKIIKLWAALQLHVAGQDTLGEDPNSHTLNITKYKARLKNMEVEI